MNRRIAVYLLLIGVGLLTLAFQLGGLEFVRQPALSWVYATSTPREPTRIFIVLDTVRADRLSICGHERPTTPVLESLVARGATVSCGAISPGPWTLPSHASFFTGKLPPEHRADHAASGELAFNGRRIRGLDERFPTLAEDLAGRGFQTAAVSGNTVVGPESGLMRGFQHKSPAPGEFTRSDRLMGQLRNTLRGQVARDGTPLFLFVNIVDAHQPYTAIPEGVGWVPPRPELEVALGGELWTSFEMGTMPQSEIDAFLPHLDDIYDYGVFLADDLLGRVLAEIEAHGWLEGGYQLVITSDHGEMLGEHGLLEHSSYLYDPVVQVPMVVFDTTRPPPALPERMSAIEAYHLVRDGELAGREVLASAHASEVRIAQSAGRLQEPDSAARWVAGQKELWMNRQTQQFDLTVDPGEMAPTVVDPSPQLVRFIELIEAPAPEDPTGSDPELERMLQAVGYLD